jgi:hypothetical protein
MADLFDLVDLPSWLQVPSVDTETATRVRRYASGWLKNATQLSVWPPDPVPDDIWAWAIELAGIAFRYPDGSSQESIDDYSRSLDTARRKEILDAAKAAYNGLAGVPQFSFPEPDWHWAAVPPNTTVITQ